MSRSRHVGCGDRPRRCISYSLLRSPQVSDRPRRVGSTGPRAVEACEPRQIRKEAALSNSFQVRGKPGRSSPTGARGEREAVSLSRVSAPSEVDQKSARTARIIRFSRFTTAALAILIFLLTFVALTPPSPYVTLMEISLVAWAILGIAWLPQLFSARFRSAWSNWGFWLYPALAFLVIVLAVFEVPFRVTFLTSRGAMNRVVNDVMTGKRDPAKISWVGLYPVSWAYRDHNSLVLEIRGTDTGTDCLGDVSNDSGFIHGLNRQSAAKSAPGDPLSISHVDGGWYSYGSWCGSG